MPLNLFGWTLPMCRTTDRATMRMQSSSNVCGPVTTFSAVLNPAGMCSTPSWKRRGPGKTKSKVGHSPSFKWNFVSYVFPLVLVSNCTSGVIVVGYILRLHCGGAAKVISTSWQQFSAAGSTTFLQNCQILRHRAGPSFFLPKTNISKTKLYASTHHLGCTISLFQKDKG